VAKLLANAADRAPAAASRAWASLPWGLALVVAGALLATRGAGLEDLDSANFALALGHYDLALHMPHFPGYPVYVAAARLVHATGADAVLSLQLPGILAWAACVPLVHRAARAWFGPAVALTALVILVLSPLPWLTAGRAGSDAMGFALLSASGAALALAAHPAEPRSTTFRIVGGLLAGLSLGVRLSYAPAIVGILALSMLRAPNRRAVLGATAVGLALWLVPFVAVTHEALVEHAGTFLTGHFTVWGGTAFVAGDGAAHAGLLSRTALWANNLWTHGLGLPTTAGSLNRWLVLPVFAIAGVSAVRSLRRDQWLNLAVVAVPYLLWLLIGQNPDKPRHLLPLLPLVALVSAIGLSRLSVVAPALPFAMLPASGAALAAVTLPLALIHTQVASPAAQLAEWTATEARPDRVQLFTGQSERVLYATHPEFRVEYAPDMAEVSRRLAHLPTAPPQLLWTDDIPGWETAPDGYGLPTQVREFVRDAEVNPHRSQLGLWTAQRLEPLATHIGATYTEAPQPKDPS
jgi:4-amino-4-deoxy-L-arabinose transferase-like glycosyltransferase